MRITEKLTPYRSSNYVKTPGNHLADPADKAYEEYRDEALLNDEPWKCIDNSGTVYLNKHDDLVNYLYEAGKDDQFLEELGGTRL